MHGIEFNGMSKNSVPPPAANAWLPVSGAFPIRVSGFVEVNVIVYQARKDMQALSIDFFPAACQFGANTGDSPILDRHISEGRPRLA